MFINLFSNLSAKGLRNAIEYDLFCNVEADDCIVQVSFDVKTMSYGKAIDKIYKYCPKAIENFKRENNCDDAYVRLFLQNQMIAAAEEENDFPTLF